jgi:hypothetical protein
LLTEGALAAGAGGAGAGATAGTGVASVAGAGAAWDSATGLTQEIDNITTAITAKSVMTLQPFFFSLSMETSLSLRDI